MRPLFFSRFLAFSLCLTALGLVTSQAHAVEVYPGCAVPSDTPNHVWYIDPVNGKSLADGGDGSAAKPWNSLNNVFHGNNTTAPLLTTVPYWHRGSDGVWTYDPKADAPIKPGDKILLMSGDYGRQTFGVYGQKNTNSDFITIEAAPGQTPVLKSITIGNNINKLYFKGLKIQGLFETGQAARLITVDKSRDIIFEGMGLSSQEDISAWSISDWTAQGLNGLGIGGHVASDQTCTSFTNSKIYNVKSGAMLMGNKTLFAYNTVDNFAGDGIYHGANDVTISHNLLTNSNYLDNGLHIDFIQGQVGAQSGDSTAYNSFSNLVIDGNILIRQTEEDSVKFPTDIQGISAFDSDWTNVTITNNVVITSACHGISFYSLHNGLIANNTVIADGSNVGVTKDDGSVVCGPGISVFKTSHGSPYPSSNVVVRNNIGPNLKILAGTKNIVADNNVVFSTITYPNADGAQVYKRTPGVYTTEPTTDGNYISHVVIDQYGPVGEFVKYDPENYDFDLHLRADALSVGAGNAARAPAVDVEGTARTAPVDIGAYAYAKTKVNGACGGYAGKTLENVPSGAGLCSAGTASDVSQTSAGYNWSCEGTGGGSTAQCLAYEEEEASVCGSSAGGSFAKTPTENLCSSGTASIVTTTNSQYLWKCTGTSTSIPCAAKQLSTAQAVLTFRANARQIGAPKLAVAVDGVDVGTVNVTADVHVGEVGSYTLRFKMPPDAEVLTVTAKDFTSTYNQYNSISMFNVFLTKSGSNRVDLQRMEDVEKKILVPTVKITNTATSFFLTGSKVSFDLSNL